MSLSSSLPTPNRIPSGKMAVIEPEFTDAELSILLEALRNFPDLHPRRNAALRLGSKINTFAVNRHAAR